MATSANRKTVLVVGAGASAEFNLPIGSGLLTDIEEALSLTVEHGALGNGGDRLLRNALQVVAQRESPTNFNPYLQAALRIRDAMSQAISIDNFIDSHQHEPLITMCGKLAIARTILAAEQHSSLYVDPSNIYNTIQFSAVSATWLAGFFRLLTENCGPTEIGDRLASVVFVVFNYDRCIEHFLYHSLQNYYRLTDTQAKEALARLEIIHPYGVVGPLPWQSNDPQQAVAYGGMPSPHQLLAVGEKIKTFTEGIDEATGIAGSIRNHVATANRVIFLGFAFHPLNLEMVLPPRLPEEVGMMRPRFPPRLYGTTFNMSGADIASIQSDLEEAGFDRDTIYLENLKCAKLLQDYWRSLSLSPRR